MRRTCPHDRAVGLAYHTAHARPAVALRVCKDFLRNLLTHGIPCATLVLPPRERYTITTNPRPHPRATISTRDFAILRHGLRFMIAAMERDALDLTPAGVDLTDLLALDIKLQALLPDTTTQEQTNG